jgi:hypothetical protein
VSILRPLHTFAKSAANAALLACLLAIVNANTAHAGGPRFVGGTTFAAGGTALTFYTAQPLYYTDPGDLSTTVTHAQADALVSAAAAVWNVAPSSLILQQGGTLNEHVSSANSYFDGTSFVFPADVQSSNYLAKPIAILYDADGSLTDLLLGQGASDPSSCRQNAVTESVDSFGYNNTLQHALILLNGRCITSISERPQQLLQMQYLVMRAFGRVIGLSWSQLNDNVFTGSPSPTRFQMQNWPVMHPIDVLCGPYSYQCMVNPFQLRMDDISALDFLYPNTNGNFAPGKQNTQLNAVYIHGPVTFATGQQAEMVNVQMKRWEAGTDGWELVPVVSSVSGFQFQQNGGNPVTGPEPDALNAGADYAPAEGAYYMPWIPVDAAFINVESETVPINPLYIGEYAVSVYQRPVISMPGTQAIGTSFVIGPLKVNQEVPVALVNAPSTCTPGNDGTEADPATADPSGWWSGLLCSTGHNSWMSTNIRANHGWTLETTALDESGRPTINKAQPVLGVWNAADPTGTLPTLAATSSSMNATTFALTQLHIAAVPYDNTVRLVVADQYGAGRPDFPYTGRIFYADAVTPSTVNTAGDTVTITGIGFRLGNVVAFNGVRGTAVSWTGTQIVVKTPSQSSAKAGSTPVDIVVSDASTGATASIPAALTFFGDPPPPIDLVSIATPSAYLAAGAAGQWPVTLTATQNGFPAAGVPVSWTLPTGLIAGFAALSTQTTTNTAGTTTLTLQAASIAAGSTSTVQGCAWTTICAAWTVYGVDPAQWLITLTSAAQQITHAAQTLAPVTFTVTDANGDILPGATVTLYQTSYAWEGVCLSQRCPSAPVLANTRTTAISDTNGLITVTPLQVPNVPQTVAIAAVTGSNGFASASLSITP